MSGIAAGRDLVAHLAAFAGELRALGIGAGVSETVDGARALTLIDLADRDEVRRALAISLRIRRADRAAFEDLFDRFWTPEPDHGRAGAPRPPSPALPIPGGPRTGVRRASGTTGQAESDDAPDGGLPGYAPEALLRKKPFDECSPVELAAMERLLARMSLRLATRRSRRLEPTRGRGIVDLRRSLRRSVGTGAELLELARRARAIEKPRLVALCDTSGSMDPHSRFLLAFILSLRRVVGGAELFAFNTSLTRLTPSLARGNLGFVLDQLAATVPDWSGGTRIGESLADFVARYLIAHVDETTVVLILSDGLDRGEPATLVEAMRAIRSRARTVIWLNPLMGDARYEPTARGMEAALPFIDHLAPAHTLESLERSLMLLTA